MVPSPDIILLQQTDARRPLVSGWLSLSRTRSAAFALLAGVIWTVATLSTFAGLQYSGKVSVSNRPYQGTGLFKFALLDDQGKLLWNNDASGSFAAVPTSDVRLSVSNGSYAVTLEDFPGARTL